MRKLRIIIFTALGLLLFAGVPLFFFVPRFQIETYIYARAHHSDGYFARYNKGFIDVYFQSDKPLPSSMVSALVRMLSDRDPAVRDETVMFMLDHCSDVQKAQFFTVPGMEEMFKRLAYDQDPLMARCAILFLGQMGNGKNDSFLREILKRRFSDEDVCAAAIVALSFSKDPQSLDDALAFVHDGRQKVVNAAFYCCAQYDDPRTLQAIVEMLPSSHSSGFASFGLSQFQYNFPKHDVSAQMDPVLLEASRNSGIQTRWREKLPRLIKDPQIQIQAWENLFLNPSTDDPVGGQLEALYYLAGAKSVSANTISALEKVVADPSANVKVQAKAEAVLKKLHP